MPDERYSNTFLDRYDLKFYKAVVKAVETSSTRLQEIEARLNEIEFLGYTSATIIYRDGHKGKENMYLYHSARSEWVQSGKSNYEYIGTKPKKVKAALDRIGRYKEKGKLEQEAGEIRRKLEATKYRFADIERLWFGRQVGF